MGRMKQVEMEEDKQINISVSLDKEGYFDTLLEDIINETKMGSKSKAVRYAILCAAKKLNLIDQDEFDMGVKFRV